MLSSLFSVLYTAATPVGLALNLVGVLIIAIPNRIWREHLPHWVPYRQRVVPDIDLIKQGRARLFSDYKLEPSDPGFQEVNKGIRDAVDSTRTPDLIMVSRPGGWGRYGDPWPKNGVAIGFEKDQGANIDIHNYETEKIGSQQLVNTLIESRISEFERKSDRVFLTIGAVLLLLGFGWRFAAELAAIFLL